MERHSNEKSTSTPYIRMALQTFLNSFVLVISFDIYNNLRTQERDKVLRLVSYLPAASKTMEEAWILQEDLTVTRPEGPRKCSLLGRSPHLSSREG